VCTKPLDPNWKICPFGEAEVEGPPAPRRTRARRRESGSERTGGAWPRAAARVRLPPGRARPNLLPNPVKDPPRNGANAHPVKPDAFARSLMERSSRAPSAGPGPAGGAAAATRSVGELADRH